MINNHNMLRKTDYLLRQPGVLQSAAVATLLLTLLIVVTVVWWLPAYQAFYQAEQRLIKDQQTLQRLQASQLLMQVYQQTQKDVHLLKTSMAAADGQAQLIRAQQALARRHNLEITGDAFSVSGNAKVDGYQGLRQELSLQGSYRSLRSFIFALSQLPGAAIINELRMEPVRQNPGVLTARLYLTLYYQAQATPGL